MKRILSFFGTITLIATSTTNLVACKPQYSEEQLAKLKEENKISINGNILEGMAPQENSFNKIDNKGYIVVWRGNKNDDGRIAKFNNNKYNVIDIDYFNHNQLVTDGRYLTRTLCIKWPSIITPEFFGEDDDGTYFKKVYHGEGDGEPDKPIIDPKTGKIID